MSTPVEIDVFGKVHVQPEPKRVVVVATLMQPVGDGWESSGIHLPKFTLDQHYNAFTTLRQAADIAAIICLEGRRPDTRVILALSTADDIHVDSFYVRHDNQIIREEKL